VPIGDKDDVVRRVRGRYGARLAHLSAEEIYAAYRAWIEAGKPSPLLDWLCETFGLDAASWRCLRRHECTRSSTGGPSTPCRPI